MKELKLTLLFLLSTFIVKAQEDYKHSLQGIKKIEIRTKTDVELTVGFSKELIIKGNKHNTNDNKKNGLRAVYAGGVDNTGHGLRIEKEENVLLIKELKPLTRRGKITIQLPKNIDIFLSCGLGNAKIKGFTSEIEVKTNVGNIDLLDITGPVTASSNTGTIKAVFDKVNQSSPISIRSNTGDVDVRFPENTKANLELRSNLGTTYTNFDVQVVSKDGMRVVGTQRRIRSKLNDGGVKVTLGANTGNVYLRKK